MFILLVGSPAIGKSVPISEINELMLRAGIFNIAPKTITRAGFIDAFGDAFSLEKDQAFIQVIASEFGVLVPAHDLEFLNTLNDLYDCPRVFNARTRSGGEKTIVKPGLHILGGTQPKYLSSLLPAEAFGMGFTSRLFMVYANERKHADMFGEAKSNTALYSHLVSDLKTMGKAQGKFHWEPAAMEAYEAWYKAGCQPEPTHPKLLNYNGRRPVHVLKITMALSMSESNSLIVTKDHFNRALADVLEAEALMPNIFQEMVSDTSGNELYECHDYLVRQYARNKKAFSERLIVSYLQSRVPPQFIFHNILSMEKSGLIIKVGEINGEKIYKPGSRAMESQF